jgi:hypothetical protein
LKLFLINVIVFNLINAFMLIFEIFFCVVYIYLLKNIMTFFFGEALYISNKNNNDCDILSKL